jgi:hypothetical protein
MTGQARPWNWSWELATLTETLIELRGSNLHSSGVPVGSLAWLSVPNGAMMPVEDEHREEYKDANPRPCYSFLLFNQSFHIPFFPTFPFSSSG